MQCLNFVLLFLWGKCLLHVEYKFQLYLKCYYHSSPQHKVLYVFKLHIFIFNLFWRSQFISFLIQRNLCLSAITHCSNFIIDQFISFFHCNDHLKDKHRFLIKFVIYWEFSLWSFVESLFRCISLDHASLRLYPVKSCCVNPIFILNWVVCYWVCWTMLFRNMCITALYMTMCRNKAWLRRSATAFFKNQDSWLFQSEAS